MKVKKKKREEFTYRKATLEDADDMQEIINYHARKEKMLSRSLSGLYEKVREYTVCENSKGKVVGCCGLHIHWLDCAEIRALAVRPHYMGRGIGSELVKMCVREAKRLKIPRVFTLTAAPEFFKKVGFKKVNKNKLPMKVWGDCLNCPKYLNCDEVALIRELV
ncbi:MAG: N-acetyltransferase [Candidatus Micrarchaeota archaeon]